MRHGSVLVTQQIIRKREFVTERLVVGRAVIAQPDNGGVCFIEVLDSITEPVSFDGSAGCVGFGIPPQQYVAAGEVVKRHRITGVIR